MMGINSNAYQLIELFCLSGSVHGHTFILKKPVTVLGRASQSEIPLHNDELGSRIHARIIRDDQGFYHVEDHHSLNGTYLNESKVTHRRILRPGDRLQLGNHLFLVKMSTDRLIPQPSTPRLRGMTPTRTVHTHLMLRHAPHEEHKLVVTKPKSGLLRFLFTLAFVLCGVLVSAQNSTAQEGMDLNSIMDQYNEHKKNSAWDDAFYLALWSVAWAPEERELQLAVFESAQQLNRPLFLLMKRDCLRHIYTLARDGHNQNRMPASVNLTLTQAVLDLNLTEHLSNGTEMRRMFERLNTQVRLLTNQL